MFNLLTGQLLSLVKRRNRPGLVVGLLLLGLLILNACASASSLTPTFGSNASTVAVISTTVSITNATATPPLITLQITDNLNENQTVTSPIPSLSVLPTSLPATTNTAPASTQAQPGTNTNGAGQVINQLVATTGCGQTPSIQPGTSHEVTIAAQPSGARGSATRSYRLHLSAKYKSTEPEAILLDFHGHGGSAAGEESSTLFSSLSDQKGFIVVYPQGIKDDDGLPMWASVGPAADYGIDDLTFTSDLLNKLQKELCVDAKRVYATGFSNGGGMSNYLACRLSGRIAAVVPISGNYFALPDGGCQPGRAVSLLEIHGTADDVIPYNGREDKYYPGWPLPSMSVFLGEWASRNGCSKGPQTFLDTNEAKGEEWTGCRDNTVVAHYQIKGGGHSYPVSIGGRPSNEVIWSFLYKHLL